MSRYNWTRNSNACLCCLRIGLYEWRKIGSSITKQIVDATIGQ